MHSYQIDDRARMTSTSEKFPISSEVFGEKAKEAQSAATRYGAFQIIRVKVSYELFVFKP